MDEKMFCFQCEQTAGGSGCKGKTGVCGKSAEVAALQDQLTGAMIALARAAYWGKESTENTYKMHIERIHNKSNSPDNTLFKISSFLQTYKTF